MEKNKTLAIYPGSFNPFHVGHQNILQKAESMFDEVIIAVGFNPNKLTEMSEVEIMGIAKARVSTIKKKFPKKNVEYFFGFLSDFVISKEKEGYNVIVVRGLRNGQDYDAEYVQSRFHWDQYPNLKFVYIPCDPMFTHVSSSACRALEATRVGSSYKYLAK